MPKILIVFSLVLVSALSFVGIAYVESFSGGMVCVILCTFSIVAAIALVFERDVQHLPKVTHYGR